MSSDGGQLQYLDCGDLAGHRHVDGYLAIVIAGVYEEVGGEGRFACKENTLVAHPEFHWHANEISNRGAVVINVPCQGIAQYSVSTLPSRLVRHIRRIAADQISETLLNASCDAVPRASESVLVARARDIIADNPTLEIADVSKRAGSSSEHLARVFRSATGMTPVAYRAECRVRHAIGAIRDGHSLASVASCLSFADQSHLGREVKRITGQTPAMIRDKSYN